jgi:hypothetical protein
MLRWGMAKKRLGTTDLDAATEENWSSLKICISMIRAGLMRRGAQGEETS